MMSVFDPYSYAVTSTMYASANLNVRSAPNTSGTPIGQIKSGDTVSIINIIGDWAQILWNGGAAYVSKSYLSGTKPAPQTNITPSVMPAIVPPAEEPKTDYTTPILIGAGVLCLIGAIAYVTMADKENAR